MAQLRERISYRDIKLTEHCKIRAQERLGITNSDELRKKANSSRYNGIDVHGLTKDNYESYGLTKNDYFNLTNKFYKCYNTDRIFLYKDIIYIFTGKRGHTLKTVLNFIPNMDSSLTYEEKHSEMDNLVKKVCSYGY